MGGRTFRPASVVALTVLFGLAVAPGAWAADADLDAALARAAKLQQPVMVMVVEQGQSQADADAATLLDSRALKGLRGRTVRFTLDISISRNRAAAARFHLGATPLLACLSARGIIVSRDAPPLSADLVLQRGEAAVQQASALDAQLDQLEAAAGKKTGDVAAQFALTDFLLAHHNAVEAIPRLEMLAHAEANPRQARLRAWIDLVRAHFWIAEPEKGRHEAEALMAALGPAMPEARAAGEFMLGSRDGETKRFARARAEFQAAIAAAPESAYGRQAAGALARLPEEAK